MDYLLTDTCQGPAIAIAIASLSPLLINRREGWMDYQQQHQELI